MRRLFSLLICVAIVVQGRPRHHKHKKGHVTSPEPPAPQASQQPTNDQACDCPSQNVNVYNLCVHKMDKDNKATGQLDAHSVAVSMQGPGMIELNTNQVQVAPGEPKPDHSISVIKDTQESQAVHVMQVHSGHELPVALPLSELPGPNAASKATKPKDLEPASKLPKPQKLHTKPHPKAASHEQQQPLKAHAQEQEPEQQASQEARVHLHRKVSKEVANKVLTKLESTLPVHLVTEKQKHEEQVTNGHKIKLTDEGKPQRVFGKVDPNNVAITMQGPGSVAVSSHLTDGSQTVIFDPRPVDPCPDKNCPHQSGRKRHKN